MTLCLALCTALAALAVACAAAQNPLEVASPDRRVRVRLELPEPGSNVCPAWSLTFGGRELLRDCRLSLTVPGEGDLLAGARCTSRRSRSRDRAIRVYWGKASTARDRFDELRVGLASTRGRRLDVVLRCYDDAVAIRYELPRQKGLARVAIAEEGTSFTPVGDPVAYAQYPANYRTPHEHVVEACAAAALKPGTLIDTPLTLAWPTGEHMAITEAALRRYAGMYLQRSPGTPELATTLAPRPDGTRVVRDLPMRTPWRVALVGDRAGALLESGTLYCLNDPPEVKDRTWIKPGKITWPWWNGHLLWPEKPGPILSLETIKQHIDWAARSGIPYHSVVSDEEDRPWYVQSAPGLMPAPGTDATRVRADLDLPAVREYAASKGVRLWTWVHQATLRGRVEECFARFEEMGWHGMMVDFFDHDDQETVEFAEEILQAAARHRIMLHFHGAWKIGGWQRTYPHLMNHEGALNLEYLKWSALTTPEHNLNMAFTRMVSGPMDYHLGGFRSALPGQFRPQNVGPLVLGTRGHHLAMYVCFDNPMQMVADYPGAYEGQAGFDVLREVPTWWDETRVLQGEVGRLLVSARRRGGTWWVGGMAAGPRREVRVPLTFLPPGRWTARIWRDSPDTARDPNLLVVEAREVSRADTLALQAAADGGGFVVRLTPIG